MTFDIRTLALISGLACLVFAFATWTVPSAQARPIADAGVTLNWNTQALEAVQGLDGAISLHLPGFETLQRPGQPEEVAHLVGFLASEQAAYISGQVISINGAMV